MADRMITAQCGYVFERKIGGGQKSDRMLKTDPLQACKRREAAQPREMASERRNRSSGLRGDFRHPQRPGKMIAHDDFSLADNAFLR